jgi:putative addiction module component (TIGR02574 family)
MYVPQAQIVLGFCNPSVCNLEGQFPVGVLRHPPEHIKNTGNWKEKEMTTTDNILREALRLKPAEKAELIDKLLYSLDKPDKEIDSLWTNEVEDRIEAYEQGELKAISLEEILQKYKFSKK